MFSICIHVCLLGLFVKLTKQFGFKPHSLSFINSVNVGQLSIEKCIETCDTSKTPSLRYFYGFSHEVLDITTEVGTCSCIDKNADGWVDSSKTIYIYYKAPLKFLTSRNLVVGETYTIKVYNYATTGDKINIYSFKDMHQPLLISARMKIESTLTHSDDEGRYPPFTTTKFITHNETGHRSEIHFEEVEDYYLIKRFYLTFKLLDMNAEKGEDLNFLFLHTNPSFYVIDIVTKQTKFNLRLNKAVDIQQSEVQEQNREAAFWIDIKSRFNNNCDVTNMKLFLHNEKFATLKYVTTSPGHVSTIVNITKPNLLLITIPRLYIDNHLNITFVYINQNEKFAMNRKKPNHVFIYMEVTEYITNIEKMVRILSNKIIGILEKPNEQEKKELPSLELLYTHDNNGAIIFCSNNSRLRPCGISSFVHNFHTIQKLPLQIQDLLVYDKQTDILYAKDINGGYVKYSIKNPGAVLEYIPGKIFAEIKKSNELSETVMTQRDTLDDKL